MSAHIKICIVIVWLIVALSVSLLSLQAFGYNTLTITGDDCPQPIDIASKYNFESAIENLQYFNKELIQLNDSTYARIHVRVDTTYYYEH